MAGRGLKMITNTLNGEKKAVMGKETEKAILSEEKIHSLHIWIGKKSLAPECVLGKLW